MIAAEWALPIPGRASSCSAVAELMSSSSTLGAVAGAIFDWWPALSVREPHLTVGFGGGLGGLGHGRA